MKSVLKYPGAKSRLASWICNYIPKHSVYVEPFFGSGAVFFHKAPCYIETINDINDEVVNFFKVLRENPKKLIESIQLTPYARKEYINAYKIGDSDSDLEKARKFCVRCWQGFGASNRYQNGWRSGQCQTSPNPAKSWSNLQETLDIAAKRLRSVQIELLELLRKHPGQILLSGYDNDLYNECLSGWKKVQKKTQAETGLKRIETLWMNYQIEQMDIFDFLS